MEPDDIVVISTTVSSEEEAKTLADAIIDSSLAACVQVFPVNSTYRWKGKVETAAEWLLNVKTRFVLAKQVQDFIKSRHSYELPEIIVTPVLSSSREYHEWLIKNTSEMTLV